MPPPKETGIFFHHFKIRINKRNSMRNQFFNLKNNKTAYFTLLISTIGMIVSSFYLTSHYFEILFPSGFATSSFCNISSFFNCDTAVHSPFSNLLGVPVALFGVVTGVLLALPILIKKDSLENAGFYLATLNGAGSLLLGFYSLIILKSLCPFCSLYYLFSWAIAGIYLFKFKRSPLKIKPIILYALIYLIVFIPFYLNIQNRISQQVVKKNHIYKQFNSYQRFTPKEVKTEMLITNFSNEFQSHTLRLILISDFQCPACKAYRFHIEEIAKRFKGDIIITYYPYPLDMNCHPKINRPFHPNACEAAYLAYCISNDFFSFHNMLYDNQDKISSEWLENIAKEKNILDCYKDPKTKQKIVEYINLADKEYKIRSTPTLIINGVKIEGVYPLAQLITLLEEILRNEAPLARMRK